jgi:hypothetical protein
LASRPSPKKGFRGFGLRESTRLAGYTQPIRQAHRALTSEHCTHNSALPSDRWREPETLLFAIGNRSGRGISRSERSSACAGWQGRSAQAAWLFGWPADRALLSQLLQQSGNRRRKRSGFNFVPDFTQPLPIMAVGDRAGGSLACPDVSVSPARIRRPALWFRERPFEIALPSLRSVSSQGLTHTRRAISQG